QYQSQRSESHHRAEDEASPRAADGPAPRPRRRRTGRSGRGGDSTQRQSTAATTTTGARATGSTAGDRHPAGGLPTGRTSIMIHSFTTRQTQRLILSALAAALAIALPSLGQQRPTASSQPAANGAAAAPSTRNGNGEKHVTSAPGGGLILNFKD